MISDDYREQNRKLHESNPGYGTSSSKWVNFIDDLAAQTKAKTILDYGCGKALLSKGISRPVVNYDPCIEEHSTTPRAADLVVCTDVLEHIEPEHLEAVLDELRSLSNKATFVTVATRPAMKTFEDGRNAHLIVESHRWWLPKLLERWELDHFNASEGEFMCVMH